MECRTNNSLWYSSGRRGQQVFRVWIKAQDSVYISSIETSWDEVSFDAIVRQSSLHSESLPGSGSGGHPSNRLENRCLDANGSRLVGYARVSSTEQETALQLAALRGANCDLIFEEKMTGSKRDRPALNAALAALRAGDTLVVWKVDRLGRSMLDSATIVRDLEQNGCHFRSLTQSFDTRDPMGKLMLNILMSFAEWERDMIIERVSAGLAASRTRGVFGGRRRSLTGKTLARARAMYADRPISAATGKPMTMNELAAALKVSRSTFYRWAQADYFERGSKDAQRFRRRHPDIEEWLVLSDDPDYGANPRRRGRAQERDFR